jgi:hypothetical protein
MEIIMFNLTNKKSKTRGREVETSLEMMAMNHARGEDGNVSFSFSCLDLVEVLEEIFILEVCGGYRGGRAAGLRPRGRVCGCPWRRLGFPSLNRRSGGRFREPAELRAEYAHRAFKMLLCLMKRTDGG